MRDITINWTNVLTNLSVRSCRMLLILRICIYAGLQVSDVLGECLGFFGKTIKNKTNILTKTIK